MSTVLARPESARFYSMIYHLAVDAECIATRLTHLHWATEFKVICISDYMNLSDFTGHGNVAEVITKSVLVHSSFYQAI